MGANSGWRANPITPEVIVKMVHLRIAYGMSYVAIGRRLHYSAQAVRLHVVRALRGHPPTGIEQEARPAL